MEIPSEHEFIEFILNHLKKTGEKPSQFGRRVLGDSAAVNRLIEGNDPRMSTARKIVHTIMEKK